MNTVGVAGGTRCAGEQVDERVSWEAKVRASKTVCSGIARQALLGPPDQAIWGPVESRVRSRVSGPLARRMREGAAW